VPSRERSPSRSSCPHARPPGRARSDKPTPFTRYLDVIRAVYRSGQLPIEDRDQLWSFISGSNPRFRTANAQFVAELLMFVGDTDRALDFIDLGIEAGLQDRLWFERCPLLDPLRELPRFATLTAVVEQRAAAVLAALGSTGRATA